MTRLVSAMDLRAESIPPTSTDPPSLPRPEAPMGRRLRSFLFRGGASDGATPRLRSGRPSRRTCCAPPCQPCGPPALRPTQHRASHRSANGPDGRIRALTGGIPAVIGPAGWAEHPRPPESADSWRCTFENLPAGHDPRHDPRRLVRWTQGRSPGERRAGELLKAGPGERRAGEQRARPAPARAAPERRPAFRTDEPQ